MDARSQLVLSAVLDFSADELAVNRAGQLSDRQEARLRTVRSRSSGALLVVVFVTVAFIVVAGVMVASRHSGGKRPGSAGEVPYVVGALLLVALLVSQSVFRTRRALNQMVSGPVSRAEGIARNRGAHRWGATWVTRPAAYRAVRAARAAS